MLEQQERNELVCGHLGCKLLREFIVYIMIHATILELQFEVAGDSSRVARYKRILGEGNIFCSSKLQLYQLRLRYIRRSRGLTKLCTIGEIEYKVVQWRT